MKDKNKFTGIIAAAFKNVQIYDYSNENIKKIKEDFKTSLLNKTHGDLLDSGKSLSEIYDIITRFNLQFEKEFDDVICSKLHDSIYDDVKDDCLHVERKLIGSDHWCIDAVQTFNEKHELINENEYDVAKGVTYIIEEVLEILGKYDSSREESQKLVSEITKNLMCTKYTELDTNKTANLIDGYMDIIVFAIGEMHKILGVYSRDKAINGELISGYDSSACDNDNNTSTLAISETDSRMIKEAILTKAFNIVMKLNLYKPHNLDENGKVVKDENYMEGKVIKQPQDAIKFLLKYMYLDNIDKHVNKFDKQESEDVVVNEDPTHEENDSGNDEGAICEDSSDSTTDEQSNV